MPSSSALLAFGFALGAARGAPAPVSIVPVMPGGMRSVDCTEPPCAYKAFRIPGLVAVNETLLAFAEGRKFGCADWSGQIDLVMRASPDNGATWGPLRTLVDSGSYFKPAPGLRPPAIRNPAPVFDAATGATFVFFTGPGSSAKDPRKWIWLMRSADAGRTWSPPLNITRQCHGGDDNRYSHASPGGGKGLQLASGRLAVPLYSVSLDGSEAGVALCYSDDHGATWQLGAPAPASQQNWAEPEVTELVGTDPTANRTLYMTIRMDEKRPHGGRYFSTSTDGGQTWAAARPVQVPDPQAKGGVVAWPAGNGLLLSNAASCTDRVNQTIWMSLDGGKPGSWRYRLPVAPNSGYSTLQMAADGHAANLFESSPDCHHISHTESGPASLSLAKVDPQAIVDAGENWARAAATTPFCLNEK